jgi:hypothetical protein
MLVLIFAIFVALVLFALVRSIIAPIMVIVAVAVGWHWLTGPSMDAKATSNTATAAPSISLPSKQAQFCAIIEKADIAYEPERSAWYSESNSIKQDRIGRRLEVMRDERDQAIYDLLSHDRLTVQGWVIRLTEMLTSEEAEAQGRVRYVSLTGTAHCQREVTFHAKLPLTPELEVLLGDTKLVRFHADCTAQG